MRTPFTLQRRHFIAATPWLVSAPLTIAGCAGSAPVDSYEAMSERTWRHGPTEGLVGLALGRELVRYATLAPSSHNTQCWSFRLDEQGRHITLRPDPSRRCPVVDPDDHHVFVSLGCATENLIQASAAHGYTGLARYRQQDDAIEVTLASAPARSTPLFQAIVERQCTRGEFDGQPLSSTELDLLQRAGSADDVRLLLLTERAAMERTLDWVIQANTAQLTDLAFVAELESWVRFNGAEAARTRDGLYSITTGNPNIPSWIGHRAFDWIVRPKGENDRYARQVRSSAGLAVFVGRRADKANWVEVGRAYERFALQATALGIRNAFLNQPVEVAAMRPPFAAALGLDGQRPDLVVRFGRGPILPRSLRRPVESVLADR
jgi:hypothetical protein